LRARGLDARLMYLHPGRGPSIVAEVRASGVPSRYLPLWSLTDPRPVLWLARYLCHHSVDLVHTHMRCANIVGRTAAGLARRPVISTIHASLERDRSWRGAARRQLDYVTARHLSARVITVCEAQRQVYLWAARVEPGRVETHLNGVDTNQFRPDQAVRTRTRAALGVAPNASLFMTVAMLQPGKGIADLLEAGAMLARQHSNVRLAVVGDGEQRAELAGLAAARRLGQGVLFLGARSDVAELLAGADVYVHPSHFEALPTSILEAMATGLPVVATNVGGVPEIVADGRSGLLVPPRRPLELAAAMEKMLDPTVQAPMGTAGRLWVEKHASSQVWLDAIIGVYQQVAPG